MNRSGGNPHFWGFSDTGLKGAGRKKEGALFSDALSRNMRVNYLTLISSVRTLCLPSE